MKTLKSIPPPAIPLSNYKIKQPTVTIPFWDVLEQKFYLNKEGEPKNANEASPGERKLKKSLIVPMWVAKHSHISYIPPSQGLVAKSAQ